VKLHIDIGFVFASSAVFGSSLRSLAGVKLLARKPLIASAAPAFPNAFWRQLFLLSTSALMSHFEQAIHVRLITLMRSIFLFFA